MCCGDLLGEYLLTSLYIVHYNILNTLNKKFCQSEKMRVETRITSTEQIRFLTQDKSRNECSLILFHVLSSNHNCTLCYLPPNSLTSRAFTCRIPLLTNPVSELERREVPRQALPHSESCYRYPRIHTLENV